MAFIEIVPPAEAKGRLGEVYEEVAGRRGAVAEILAVHSLMPETMLSHVRYYMDIVYGKGPLTRLEREAIAVAVSAANDCAYCVAHHSDALGRYLKDPKAVRLLSEDLERAAIDEPLRAFCRYAQRLTTEPGSVGEDDIVALREAGWSDEAILHGVQVACYFNFVNRMALGLGVELEGSFAAFKHEDAE